MLGVRGRLRIKERSTGQRWSLIQNTVVVPYHWSLIQNTAVVVLCHTTGASYKTHCAVVTLCHTTLELCAVLCTSCIIVPYHWRLIQNTLKVQYFVPVVPIHALQISVNCCAFHQLVCNRRAVLCCSVASYKTLCSVFCSELLITLHFCAKALAKF